MKLSIAIICYNYGRFLSTAITSALTQDLSPGDKLDVLVIDDGSTDETPRVCAAFEGRVRVLRSANQGFAASLTRAIYLAEGEYVCLMDADDYFAPHKLRTIRPLLRAGALYVDHRQYFVDEHGSQAGDLRRGGNTSTICVQRGAALPLLPVENEAALHVLLKAGTGVRLSDALSFYRLHGESMTDRRVPGRQNDYLAGVHHRLASRLRVLDPLPPWMPSNATRHAIARDFDAVGHYNEVESALERGERAAAVSACARMLRAAWRSNSGYPPLYFKTIAKTILMRPSLPKPS